MARGPKESAEEFELSVANRKAFSKRLQQLVDQWGGVQEFASNSFVSASAIRAYLQGKSEPSRAALISMAFAGQVPVGWLATGEGAPDRAATHENMEAAGFAMIPLYDVSASAGMGLLTTEENIVDFMAFKLDWIRRAIGTDPANLCLIRAIGDSMEPTIRSGDLLLVDRSIDRILDDSIYVIVRAEVLVVKRIQRFFKGAVVIKSDNPSYVDETIGAGELDELRVAGRVRWIARMI